MRGIEKVKLLILGLVAGFFSAALGIGGGPILVAALVLLFGFDIKKAVGSSLATIIPIAFVGIITHLIINFSNARFLVALFVIMGSIIGARFGVDLAVRISGRKLRLLFVAVLFLIGLKLTGIFRFPTFTISGMPAYPFLMVFGFVTGSASALFGIGGGIIMVPILYLFFGFSMHQAIPTSLCIILPTAFAGVMFHRKFDNVDFRAVRLLVPIAPVGACLGAIAANILPGTFLRIVFGILMIFCAVRIFLAKQSSGP